MNADILRLILFLAGLALILGIYFWDRRKRANARVNAVHKAEKKLREKKTEMVQAPVRREPVWDAEQEARSVDETARAQDDSEVFERLGAMVQDEQRPAGPLFEPLEQTTFQFDREERAPEQLPLKILQLNVRSRQGELSGEAILQAAAEVNLNPGEMKIFHYQLSGGKGPAPLFSMASIVEPGTFPFEDMAGFRTPGVTLFAQLPGIRDGLETFDRMLQTAKRLALLLNAEVLDETRSDMSRQTIEHIREEIMEHSRRVRLARSRR